MYKHKSIQIQIQIHKYSWARVSRGGQRWRTGQVSGSRAISRTSQSAYHTHLPHLQVAFLLKCEKKNTDEIPSGGLFSWVQKDKYRYWLNTSMWILFLMNTTWRLLRPMQWWPSSHPTHPIRPHKSLWMISTSIRWHRDDFQWTKVNWDKLKTK